MVLGGLAVDQISATMPWLSCSVLVGDLRAQAIALFSRHEEQTDVDSLLAQPFRGGDLCGDDAFRVA